MIERATGHRDGGEPPRGQCDFVTESPGPLPLQIICDMMGIPRGRPWKVFHWTTVIMGFGDDELPTITTSSCKRNGARERTASRSPRNDARIRATT